MLSHNPVLTKPFNEIPIHQISINQAYRMAIRAKNKKETQKANGILAIISRAIKEDGKRGYYTGIVQFVGSDEQRLLSIDDTIGASGK